ncbi:DUF6048 family protein [Jejuia spongiicola]|uniref:DUF6048 family protein n=1 Tax=Jejuia spongiicola TaxID=2942207 RepID=A0ABT0QGA6_9FLAO|nr:MULTISPECIES: DUF6048 family protein [Flavobacteriaceae]MCL6296016.1 DUF6048 family protein [Jejuia spongiicola]PIA80383.1 hypothetical protein BFR04_17125 [Gaetbulibacter sp. 4G1]
MKQQRILTYFISSALLLLFCVSANAQNDSIASPVNDSLKIKQKYGLRVGADIGKLIRTAIDDEYSGFEISADYRLKKKLYIAGEIGTEEKTDVNNYLNITTKGSYLKGGIDYNSYQNWLDMDNMIYFGFRVGASTFSHTLNSFNVYNTNQYWGEQFSSTTPQKFDGLTAIWAEIILGIKAELFNNLYMGLNVQLKGLVNETEPENFQNIYIPGFNKTYDSSRIGVGYSYTISYRIPLYKRDN